MSNIDIIKSTYEGTTSQENGQNLVAHASDTITWKEADGFAYAGTYHGMNDITENVFQKLASEWYNYTFTPQNYLSQDDTVVVYGTYSGTYIKTGKKMQARVAHIWQLKNQKITHFEQIVDSKMVFDAMQ
ncbi:nuclear transport factor 2 family protein [Pseudoalteromonas fuliginea]|uniref:nuclear transport factor 2 family protein n=1 Tax=Pseudoalteromonas fuliginea TaxID=1872678 RepID=UPI003182495A